MSDGFLILGVDPGLTGALAFYAPGAPHLVTVDDMPVAGKHVDPAALARRIRQMSPDLAIVELVGSMPGQGVSSSFKFGCGYGMVQGVVLALGIPLHLVAPGRWKRHFRLPADKEQARSRAIHLWPTSDSFGRKKDSGRAEAALIARYGAEEIFGSAPLARSGLAERGGASCSVPSNSSPRGTGVPA